MNRTRVSAEARELAELLIAVEAASVTVSEADAHATCRVCEKLRRPLLTLTGKAGFSSLLLRALTLATDEAPVLSVVKVKADGSMEGLEGAAGTATPILVAYLLSLLITFIGDTLTMHLLHDIWPDLPGARSTALGKDTK